MPIQKVLIVGGGLAGLVLAQGLKKNGIPFEIFERDESPNARQQGLSLSVHWALKYIEECMDPELFKEIGNATVNPSDPTNMGFSVLDGASGKVLMNLTPPAKKNKPHSYRMNRKRFREFLGKDLNIQWNKRLKEYEVSDDGVTVHFEDGSEARGDVLVGADGAKSRICKQLRGPDLESSILPVTVMGFVPVVNGEVYKNIHAVSPTHGIAFGPPTGSEGNYAMFFTLNDCDIEKDQYHVLVSFSWLNETGKNGLPEMQADKVKLAKKVAQSFSEPFRSLVLGMDENEYVHSIRISEKIPGPWKNQGRITLIGDAAHSMSMFRGEGGNHAMRDSGELCSHLVQAHKGNITLQTALDAYEKEMIARTTAATKDSHDAAFFVHKPLSFTTKLLMRSGSAALKVYWYMSDVKSYVFGN
ncbi:hypothetical protein Unana1_02599 [Umbelopsis nana]